MTREAECPLLMQWTAPTQGLTMCQIGFYFFEERHESDIGYTRTCPEARDNGGYALDNGSEVRENRPARISLPLDPQYRTEI